MLQQEFLHNGVASPHQCGAKHQHYADAIGIDGDKHIVEAWVEEQSQTGNKSEKTQPLASGESFTKEPYSAEKE